mmetsp:Transcript_13218/g.18431  ORF Transcript_13218/g.18431 Transcript_13218/m.18431 type:complete len:593 (-) Transcript_13218:2829-4607(-)
MIRANLVDGIPLLIWASHYGYGDTPLIWASRYGHDSTIKHLVDAKVDIEAKTYYGDTPLIWASRNAHESAVKLLIDAKANIEAKNNDGNTPLTLASEKGYERIGQHLKDANRSRNQEDIPKSSQIRDKTKNVGVPLSNEAIKRLFSRTTPWRRSRVMIVGKEHTGKTTLYMALKGEAFREVESTNVADVTVDDVTVETTNAEENITETVFKPAELGGNHERALALAFTKEKEGKEREKKKMADNQQRFRLSDKEKVNPSGNEKNTTINANTAAVKEDTTDSKKERPGQHSSDALVESKGNDTSEDATDSKKLHKRSKIDEEMLLKELKPGRLQESLDNPEAIRVSVWDFAGQEVFYTSHVIFLNRNCLYMVVFSLEEFLGREADAKGNIAANQKEKTEEYLRYWLQNIRTFAPGAPIVLVGTKIDKLKEYDDPEALLDVLEDIDEHITRIAREVFEGCKSFPWSRCKRWRPKEAAEPADLVFFPADSKFRSRDGKVHSTIKELRNEVLEKLKNDPKANQEVPSEWTKVCDDLIATEQAVFTLKTVKEICLRRGIVDGREVRLMLQKYHELGLAIYFDEGGLRDGCQARRESR